MSEIDWSKAPEGATHYAYGVAYPWLKVATGSVSRFEAVAWVEYISPEIAAKHVASAIKRPSTPAWNGEGLPPVGTSIEWFSPIYGWIGGRVVDHDSSVTVVVRNDGYTGCHPHGVRPIRTPEQIAAEEREKAIDEMVGLMCQDGAFDHEDPEAAAAMGKLYDAGYRKVEP